MSASKLLLTAIVTATLTLGSLGVNLTAGEISEPEKTPQPVSTNLESISADTEGCAMLASADHEKIRIAMSTFTNMQRLAETMADPMKFSRLMWAINDPATMHQMMQCGMRPASWKLWQAMLSDPEQLARAMGVFMNPAVIMAWMMAPMNPEFYKPMQEFMNPDYYQRWATASRDPNFYKPATNLMNPAWYKPRMEFCMLSAHR